MSALAALFKRDIQVAVRIGGGALIGVLFFMSVVVMMPFAIGPDLALLKRIGPAILWLGALLASLLALDRLLSADQDDGSLDLLTMSTVPLELAVGVKALAHWLTTALPLVVVSPLLSLFLNLDITATAAVTVTLLVGTPALTFIGLIGAGLTVTLRRGGLLLPVLILPLAVLYELLALPLFRRMYRPAYLEGTLSQGLCPFCLYDLSKVEPGARGCVTCPECSGAWNACRLAPTPPS